MRNQSGKTISQQPGLFPQTRGGDEGRKGNLLSRPNLLSLYKLLRDAGINANQPRTFTVICHWHPPSDACEPWQSISVVIAGCLDEQDAANNACLYLIRERQGEAEAWLVIKGKPSLFVPDGGTFDAEEFDDTITFAGKIVSKQELS